MEKAYKNVKKVWTNLKENMRKLKRKDDIRDIRLFDKYYQIRKKEWEKLKESMKNLKESLKKT